MYAALNENVYVRFAEIAFKVLKNKFSQYLHFIIYTEQEGGHYMRIELEGSLLKMTPENDREKEELNQLWTIIIGCIDEGKKLVPVGEYIPGVKEVAVFNIE
jgi:hypothetical protein